MQAVILVGGEGTRLHPLTFDLPKPMVPICGRPFMEYQLNLLKDFGISEVIFSLGYKWKVFEDYFYNGRSLGIKLHYMVEETPLGTGGAIKNVEGLLDGKTFFVFNGDILAPFDLKAIYDFHKEKKSKCTIALTPVDNPSIYGVVEMDESGKVERFTEKPPPDQIRSNRINAGLYVLEPEILNYMESGKAYSIERQIFPRMLEDKISIFGFNHQGYWMDIGSPRKYLKANMDVLSGVVGGSPEKNGKILTGKNVEISKNAKLEPPLFIGDGAKIKDGAVLIGPAVVGNNCIIGKKSMLKEALLWDNTVVGDSCTLDGCLVGRSCCIEEGVNIAPLAVVGSKCRVSAGKIIEGEQKINNTI